jgi:hypothetical protein
MAVCIRMYLAGIIYNLCSGILLVNELDKKYRWPTREQRRHKKISSNMGVPG